MVEYGFCPAAEYSDGTQFWSKLEESGAKWIRSPLGYGANHKKIAYFKKARSKGIKILGIISQRFHTPIGLSDWRQACQKAWQWYGDCIDALEVWNEPDLPKFHAGYMDGSVQHYLDMTRIVYEERQKEGFSHIPIVAGSVATMRTTQNKPGDYYGGYFLKKLHEAHICDYADIFSIHIYNWFLNGYDALNSLTDCYDRARSYDPYHPVWITEIGECKLGESAQAQRMESWFAEIENAKIPVVHWYGFHQITSCGVLKSGYVEKECFKVFQEYAGGAGPPPCNCTGWVNHECVDDNHRRQTRTCFPSGCDVEERTVYDATCASTCDCTPWENAECIDETHRKQIRSCTPPGCDVEERSVYDPTCAPTRTVTLVAFAGGTTDPAPGLHVVEHGSNFSVTAIPDEGFLFDHWEFNMQPAGSALTLTRTVTENIVIYAIFKVGEPPPGCVIAFLLGGVGGSGLLPWIRLLRSQLPLILVNHYYLLSDTLLRLMRIK